jgi:hypothetical protein
VVADLRKALLALVRSQVLSDEVKADKT